MGQGMSEVVPGVYVTSAIVARQAKVLDEFGITHVISIQGKPISPFSHREYLLISAKDHISQDLLQYVPQCNDFIHAARLNRGKILIHCVEGKSRSPSIACIYLMTITGLSWYDTINSLRGVRTLVDPNFAFQRQLKRFNDELMLQERERLFAKFGPFSSIDNDTRFVLNNLTLYNEDQRRRYVIDLDSSSTSISNNKPISSLTTTTTTDDEIAPHLDSFFENTDLTKTESQKLLDEMFSS